MNLRLTSSALALAAMTAPAFADVTSEQVWQSWVDYYSSAGYQVTEGKREKAGDTLTITDMTVAFGKAEAEADVKPDSTLTFSVPQITLTETGDGKVRTVYADQAQGNFSGTDAAGDDFTLDFTLDMPGNATVTSGAPEDMTHEFDYPTMDVALGVMKTGDKEQPLPVRISLKNSTGKMHNVAGATAKYDYDFKSERLTFSGDVVTDENDGKVKFDGDMAGLEMVGQMSLPSGQDMAGDMNAALKAGLIANGTVKFGATAAMFDFAGTSAEGQPQTAGGKYDAKGFDVTFAMSQDGLGYQGNSDAAAFELTTSDVPFPIKYAAESASFDIQLPVMKADAAQPFKFAYSLGGLTLGDELWNLFDAQGALPRDPASLDLDLTGLMKVNEDLFDPASMAPDMPAEDAVTAADAAAEAAADAATDPATDPAADPASDMAPDMAENVLAEPIVPTQVTINQFALSLMGARITATGELKAAEGADIATAPPIGQIKAEYEGVNGLVDKLAGMGLIPEDQLMGVRMMLAMFAKPVAEGEDKLTTDLEFKEGGAIFANGQQIQ